MQIIGMTGLAQCGKTTLAREIARIAYERGMNPKLMSFAGSLKTAAAAVGASKDRQPDLYRRFCQEVGFNFRQPEYVPGVTGPNYWVDLTKADLRAMEDQDKLVVIFDDVRFENEVSMLRDMQAEMIHIDRGDDLPDPEAEFRKHDSERLAYDLLGNDKLRKRLFQWSVSSSGSMNIYLTSVRPYIPVWLGLEAMA